MLSLLAHPLYIDRRTDRWSFFAKATQGKISVFLIMGLKIFGRLRFFIIIIFLEKHKMLCIFKMHYIFPRKPEKILGFTSKVR